MNKQNIMCEELNNTHLVVKGSNKQRFWIALKLIGFLLLISCCLNSCSKGGESTTELSYEAKARLVLEDSLVFMNTDSTYIGSIRDIEVFNGNIYISDDSHSKIIILDKDMRITGSIGRYGNGPDEFPNAPYLSKKSDALVVWSRARSKYILYNERNEKTKEILLDPQYYYTVTEPVFINNKIVIAASKTAIRDLKKQLNDDFTTALIANDNGYIEKRFDRLLSDYMKNSDLTFYNLSTTADVIEGFNNTIFVHQEATYKLKQYDKNGNYIRTLEYKPRYYVGPPELKLGNEPQDMDAIYEKYYTKQTYFSKLVYDKKSDLIYVNYRTLHRYQYQTRSFLDADNNLLVFNNKDEVIYDEKIEGYLVSVDNGYAYFLNEESPQRIVILKYKIEM